jgi:hypothetical protein
MNQAGDGAAGMLAKEDDLAGGVGYDDSPGRSLAEGMAGEKAPDVLFAIVGLIVQERAFDSVHEPNISSSAPRIC